MNGNLAANFALFYSLLKAAAFGFDQSSAQVFTASFYREARKFMDAPVVALGPFCNGGYSSP